jgi:8-oxo-dGTP diphosphatase
MTEAVIHVVGAAIVRDGRCLVAERGPGMSLPGKWEFPGGKVEPGETPESALAREIAEELGLRVAVAEQLGTGTARAGTKLIRLDVYGARMEGGELVLREHARAVWATAAELASFDWAEADIPSVASVAAWLAQPAQIFNRER